MSVRRLQQALSLAFAALLVGCTDDGRRAGSVAAPSFDVTSSGSVSGQVLGADGTSICNFIHTGSYVVRVLNLPPAVGFAGSQFLRCPATNSFSIPVAAGTYQLLVRLPPDPAVLGDLPFRTLVTTPLTVGGGDVHQDVQIFPGTALGGVATLDGAPLADVELDVDYDQVAGFPATIGISGADGAWAEFIGRPTTILQNDVRYDVPGGCNALGTRALAGPPTGGFLFPTEVSAINCTLETAPSVQFSHTHTRLVVTPMPGDIGGQSVELTDQYGLGWGVQFPVEPGQSPAHTPVSASHLFGGGLLIGIAPDRILSGISLAGQLGCGAACRDLGLDGHVGFTDETPAGKKVIWHYSDATSPEGVGLRVVQRSFDGQSPNDYVLFRFAIQNGGSSSVTFYAGVFMDWDVDEDPTDDFGFTDLAGRLMGVTSAFESGVHVGSLLVGAPVSGNLFYNFNGDVSIPSSPADQFQALSGGMRLTEIGLGDAHYIHGVGPVTLARGKKADIWLAIVAGDNRDRFLANARAAQADIAKRQQGGGAGEDADATRSVSTAPLGVPMRPLSKSQKPE